MDHIPLFTQAELTTAYRLLLPPDLAAELARRWFETFVDDDNIDEAGRYLYVDWRDYPDLPEAIGSQPTAVISQPPTVSGEGMYDWLISMPREDLQELLLSFSDFHLDLVAVSSPSLRTRVELIRRRDPQTSTERRCRELREALDSMNE
jgi:hypothetical protein